MLVTLGAMALVAAGGGNYVENDVKEHHGKLASISLDGTALVEKINYMGFGGRNSTWSNDFKEVTTTRGSMALGCKALNGQKGMKRMVSSGFEALKRVKREKVMYLYTEFKSPWLMNVTKMALMHMEFKSPWMWPMEIYVNMEFESSCTRWRSSRFKSLATGTRWRSSRFKSLATGIATMPLKRSK
jgi:hypothetical protein